MRNKFFIQRKLLFNPIQEKFKLPMLNSSNYMLWRLIWFYVLQVRIARIFNTYGPRMCLDDGRVVSNFVAQVRLSFLYFQIILMLFSYTIHFHLFVNLFFQAIRKQPLTVYGDGKQTRSFQYVSDLVYN